MSMQNPAEFWGDEMGANSNSEVVRAYARQTIVDQNQQNLFNKIGLLICKIHRKEFLKGWIDLDYWWNHSEDPAITKYRTHKTLTKIKTPYSGRLAYLVRVLVDKAKDANKDRTGDLVFGDMKPTKRGYYLTGQICVFHNEALGWQKVQKKRQVVKGVLTTVEEENTSKVFFYKRLSFFPTTSCGTRMFEEVQPYIKPEAVIYAYFLGKLKAQSQEYEGRVSIKHTLNVDDYMWMRSE